ncbi:TIGR03862 family flavoprotein [Aquabacterium sp.]|uniref:TIGR03862 family flavoprotein n=1 Tax=Aquabacterium sp. TaxID=1872578 RepID=UPI0035B17550
MVIGAGPAGLMAAETLAQAGIQVDVYDASASAGRKFLLAGRGGLNLTHSEPLAPFLTRFGPRQDVLAPVIEALTPEALRAWAAGLGIDTFVGTSGRVFPSDMKAAPLLRAWMHRLRQLGVRFHMRHRWLGMTPNGAWRFATPDGERQVEARTALLALGGGSWARLGSDGAWVSAVQSHGVDVAPLKPANCGFHVAPTGPDRTGWSALLKERHAGQPVKPVAITFTDLQGHTRHQQGEFVVTEHGVEGSLIYAFSAAIRDTIDAQGQATILLDLLPAYSPDQVLTETRRPRGTRSLSTHLKSRLGIQGLKMTLLYELLDTTQLNDPVQLAQALKALPVTLTATRPIDEAISTAGGVCFESLDAQLMARQWPGVFFAGEMLDWEAPTGGYLLTASMASGKHAAQGILSHIAS